ncbi:putative hydrolase or acyltransferase RutD in novel pyrimidine catabolism pathway [Yersinia enterocolitica]|nr:putative hydrolase or acyltransferase RutD in novel pyrimidine catabolism pathway [Yersinia enterocolitica]
MSYGGHAMSVAKSEQFNGILLSYLLMDTGIAKCELALNQSNTSAIHL